MLKAKRGKAEQPPSVVETPSQPVAVVAVADVLRELPAEYSPKYDALIRKGLAVRYGNRVLTTMEGEKLKA